MKKEIRKLLDHQIIQPSASHYLNPLVVVTKKIGSVRICLEARKLNNHLLPDYEQSENIDEVLRHCNGKRVFNTIDLTQSFYQFRLEKESRK